MYQTGIVSIKYVFCLTEAQLSEKSSTAKAIKPSCSFNGPHTSTQTFTEYTCQYLLRGLLERLSRGALQNNKVKIILKHGKFQNTIPENLNHITKF